MDSFKIQQMIKSLEDIRDHLSASQGHDLKSLLDSSRKPADSPISDLMKPKDEMDDSELGAKPKGIAIEKVSLLAKPKQGYDDKVNEAIAEQSRKPGDDMDLSKKLPGEEEMTDDELEELLKRFKK